MTSELSSLGAMRSDHVSISSVKERLLAASSSCVLNAEEEMLFKSALMIDLKPQTALEVIYATDIAECILEMRKMRRIRDATYLSFGRDFIWRRIRTTSDGRPEERERLAQTLAQGWFEQDKDTLRALDGFGLSVDHVMAAVHHANTAHYEKIELSIQRLERRRRALLEDLEKIRIYRPNEGVEDAEIV